MAAPRHLCSGSSQGQVPRPSAAGGRGERQVGLELGEGRDPGWNPPSGAVPGAPLTWDPELAE